MQTVRASLPSGAEAAGLIDQNRKPVACSSTLCMALLRLWMPLRSTHCTDINCCDTTFVIVAEPTQCMSLLHLWMPLRSTHCTDINCCDTTFVIVAEPT
jgi:hypothetical protein